MAHAEKYKAAATGHLLGHYERDAAACKRENVDASRTPMNYTIAYTKKGIRKVKATALTDALQKRMQTAQQMHEKTTGRKQRSDGVLMVDWVVTLPDDCPSERAPEFFQALLQFAYERYGYKCVVGGYVHMDETTPHMHVPVVPLKDGKLNAKDLICRADLKTWHDDFQGYLQEHGIPGTVVDVGGKKRPNLEAKLSQADLKKLDKMIDEEATLRSAESRSKAMVLKKRIDELEAENESLREQLRGYQTQLRPDSTLYVREDSSINVKSL